VSAAGTGAGGAALALLLGIAVLGGAGSGGCCGDESHVYVIPTPDASLAAALDSCSRDPFRNCSGFDPSKLECLSPVCLDVCKRVLEIAGAGSHQDDLVRCRVETGANVGAGARVHITFNSCIYD
jgi:hypothetical protein